jgi:hypothetical protein
MAAFVIVPPAIGVGNAGGFQMQVEQKDGGFITPSCRPRPTHDPGGKHTVHFVNLVTSFRANAPRAARS